MVSEEGSVVVFEVDKNVGGEKEGGEMGLYVLLC